MTANRRALKILLDSFWSPAGWKPEASCDPSSEDFEYAKAQGVMFDPVLLDHTQAQAELIKAIEQLDRRRVANAFLASLSTRRLDLRSAFGSFVVFQHMASHVELDVGGRCGICGMHLGQFEENLNVLNFERHKWGGVRHDQVAYAALDLRLFLQEPAVQPVPEDMKIFRALIGTMRALPPETTSSGLQVHFAKSLKSNKAERDVLIGLLGFCGILGTQDHPGYPDAFVPACERRLPDRRFVDMSYPVCWWTGRSGVNETKLEEYFGHAL